MSRTEESGSVEVGLGTDFESHVVGCFDRVGSDGSSLYVPVYAVVVSSLEDLESGQSFDSHAVLGSRVPECGRVRLQSLVLSVEGRVDTGEEPIAAASMCCQYR